MHPLSLKNGARPKSPSKMIFEKMSIHNKIVVQELSDFDVVFEFSQYSILNSQYSNLGSRKISTLDKSIILSYLIISFTTKSLILAQDER